MMIMNLFFSGGVVDAVADCAVEFLARCPPPYTKYSLLRHKMLCVNSQDVSMRKRDSSTLSEKENSFLAGRYCIHDSNSAKYHGFVLVPFRIEVSAPSCAWHFGGGGSSALFNVERSASGVQSSRIQFVYTFAATAVFIMTPGTAEVSDSPSEWKERLTAMKYARAMYGNSVCDVSAFS